MELTLTDRMYVYKRSGDNSLIFVDGHVNACPKIPDHYTPNSFPSFVIVS